MPRREKKYMEKTKAYELLNNENPLEDLIVKTNDFLRALWANKHISQGQYEKLAIHKRERKEAKLSHLYFLPKAHKTGTPLRSIISGMKSPTISISKWLDNILRLVSDNVARETTIHNGVQLIKEIEKWSRDHMKNNTVFMPMDVTDLYTMIPQEGGIRVLKHLMERAELV